MIIKKVLKAGGAGIIRTCIVHGFIKSCMYYEFINLDNTNPILLC